MNDSLIGAIQTFTLQARTALEREAHEQLEGLYGWLPDGVFASTESYPALAALPEAAETRSRLEQYARDEAEAGLDAAKVRIKLGLEAAFTWLNRFVAFKMLETRRLLKTVLAPSERANAYIFWLTDGHDPEAIKLHDAGDMPVNVIGEGPRQTAYRHFLLWQCRELAKQVSVLFDPATLASRLCPRPKILRELIEALNSANLSEAWTAGNEETIGWTYQAFSSDELQAAFAAARESKKKFEAEDIPAVTQLFTIRWVVRYLVENSLGRLWIEMHPDSTLKDKLGYLVPPAGESVTRPLKAVREILFLDPSCGSMHFGLVAFDLLVEMYREEIANAGHPGWPTTPSISAETEIPAAIVAHNLHGIDIDPRAVQVAALALLIKARSLNPKAVVTDHNLACCNVEAITGGRLDAMIQGAAFVQPIYERIMRIMAARLKDSGNLGSLLRPECDLERLIDDERAKFDRSVEMLPGMGESDLFSLDSSEKRERFFAGLSVAISVELDAFVQRSRAAGKDESHFVGEASKGLSFLRLVQQRYDVVATNPPYLSGRKMNKRLVTLMAEEYHDGKGDLFAAFIQRCAEFLDHQGLMGMLTMHSYMFISSYEGLRTRLRGELAIKTIAHFGGGLFAVGNPGTLQTTAFIFEKQTDAVRRDASVGTYFRLVKERNAEAKRLAFESALAAIRANQYHSQVFIYKQSDFDAIPGKPWVYWITSNIRAWFTSMDRFAAFAKPWVGLQTSHNERFLRFWWEVGIHRIGRGCATSDDFLGAGKKWAPHMKGGKLRRWYGNQEYVVNWGNDGAEMKAHGEQLKLRVKSAPGNGPLRDFPYYFRPGVTWTHTTAKGLNARLMPPGFICNVEGMASFPDVLTGTEKLALGILNSKIACFITNQLNPTIHYGAREIGDLPAPKDVIGGIAAVGNIVTEAVAFAALDSQECETTWDFVAPLCKLANLGIRKEQIAILEAQIDSRISRLYGLSEGDLAAIDRELTDGTSISEDEEPEEADETDDEAETAEDISASGWVRSWVSYAIGTVLGRFEIGVPGGLGRGEFSEAIVTEIRKLVDNDGIMPCEAGHAQDLAARAVACLILMVGADAARDVIHTATGETGDLVDALRSCLDRFTGNPEQSFWRYHFQKYRKRPVYWPFQSPGRRYTVWVFHERLGSDALFRICNEFVEPRLRLAEREIADLRVKAASDRKAAKSLDGLLDFSDDLRAFVERLKAITERGYTPQIDDGVLLNAAPLHELLPSWPETRKAWKELGDGKYDWAHQAMAYWPERVRAACLTNKSFAIAHGLAAPEEVSTAEVSKRRSRKKKE